MHYQPIPRCLHVYDPNVASPIKIIQTGFLLEISISASQMQTLLASYQQSLSASFGGWIDVFNLPPPLWTDAIFKFIGDHCGGFFGIYSQSDRGVNFRVAQLRNTEDFIPSQLQPFNLVGKEWTVYLQGIQK